MARFVLADRCSPKQQVGPTPQAGLEAPFLIAGALKSIYDLGLYALFRDHPEGEPSRARAETSSSALALRRRL
jgi:hypothetical protein